MDPSNDYSQDTIAFKGLPVMCIVNDKKEGLINSHLTKIQSLNEYSVCIDDVQYSDVEFAKHFVPAFAYTNHKVQGDTIRQPFHIHEWSRMSKRERYTAFSRGGLTRNEITISP